ncbi:MAG: sigma-70 family RNA polymerase sigma factor [Bacteroidales bacterium]
MIKIFNNIYKQNNEIQTDKQIIDAILKGDNVLILNYIYKYHLPKVSKLLVSLGCNREEVKDFFQEAVIVLYKKIKMDVENFSSPIDSYICQVAKYLYYNSKRKETVKNNYKQQIDKNEPIFKDYDLESTIDQENEKKVQKILEMLGETCAKILRAIIFEEKDYKEIAEEYGFSSSDVVKTSKNRCKNKLLELINENSEVKKYLENNARIFKHIR